MKICPNCKNTLPDNRNYFYVVAIPKDLHQLYYGKHHREMCMDVVKQFYLRDDNNEF
jgi:hypothetical protein